MKFCADRRCNLGAAPIIFSVETSRSEAAGSRERFHNWRQENEDSKCDAQRVRARPGDDSGARRKRPGVQSREGVHLAVKTKTGTVEVYLAPKNFMDFLKSNYVPGDEVEITGSRVKSGNSDILLAREVDDGRDVIDLRDLNGAPVWEHWGVEADPANIH